MGNVSPLPFANFQWVDDISNFNVMTIALDSPTGYILEVDLEYPQHLHDAHADFLFCRAINRPVNVKTSCLPRYTIRNVTLFIIATYSNVLVMVCE